MSMARAKGICAEGYEEMRTADGRNGLVDYYVANPDWCLEREFPDLQTLEEEFADCEDKGVFVNKMFHGELLNDLQAYVFHNCRGTVKVGLNIDKAIIPMLYVANGCRIRFVGAGDAETRTPVHVPVYMFGKNDVSAHDNKYVKFIKHKQAEE